MIKDDKKKTVLHRPGIIKPKKASLLNYKGNMVEDSEDMDKFNPEGAIIEDMEDLTFLDNWNSRELHEIIMRDEFYED